MARKPARYLVGVVWIAANDEPEEMHVDTVAEMISTMLLADLFQMEPLAVAKDIVAYRTREVEAHR